MKKSIILVAAITVILGGIYFFQDTQENISGNYNSKYGRIDVDPKGKVDLDFSNSRIKVRGWEKDYVSIKTNPWYEKKGKLPEIAFSGNNITLRNNPGSQSTNIVAFTIWPWFPLAQFKTYQEDFNDTTDNHEFLILVPHSVKLKVQSGILDAENATLVYVKGNMISLDKCILPEDFKSDADWINVRDSVISNKAVINKKSSTMRDNTFID